MQKQSGRKVMPYAVWDIARFLKALINVRQTYQRACVNSRHSERWHARTLRFQGREQALLLGHILVVVFEGDLALRQKLHQLLLCSLNHGVNFCQ